jgi:hypothetical protein
MASKSQRPSSRRRGRPLIASVQGMMAVAFLGGCRLGGPVETGSGAGGDAGPIGSAPDAARVAADARAGDGATGDADLNDASDAQADAGDAADASTIDSEAAVADAGGGG